MQQHKAAAFSQNNHNGLRSRIESKHAVAHLSGPGVVASMEFLLRQDMDVRGAGELAGKELG